MPARTLRAQNAPRTHPHLGTSALEGTPDLARILFAALLCACGAASLACTRQEAAEVLTYGAINNIRAGRGLLALRPDARLVAIARRRSEDMAARDYFSHRPPDGCDFACLIDRYEGPHEFAGENIAWNTYPWTQSVQVAVEMWRNSPEHMANILNCHYERFGTGVATGSNGKIYYTMVFEGLHPC